ARDRALKAERVDVHLVTGREKLLLPGRDRAAQRLVAGSRDRQDAHPTRRKIFDDDVAIRSAPTERADTCQPPRSRGPRLERALHSQLQVVEVDIRIWPFVVEARRQRALLHRQNDLREARDACGTLQMPYVGLHRTDANGSLVRTARTEDRAER